MTTFEGQFLADAIKRLEADYVATVRAAMTDEQRARVQAGERVRVDLGNGLSADVESYRGDHGVLNMSISSPITTS